MFCIHVGDRDLQTLGLPERLVTSRMALIVPCSLKRSSSVSLVQVYGRPEIKILCFSIDVLYLKTCQEDIVIKMINILKKPTNARQRECTNCLLEHRDDVETPKIQKYTVYIP